MSEIDYIDADQLVFSNDVEGGIHSGGFSVNSIMMKAGISPIRTLNGSHYGGTTGQVSDLFADLVVPNWALSYNNRIVGGKYREKEEHESDNDSDDVIEDDLHDKLLELVKEHSKTQKTAKKQTQKPRKTKKTGTRRKKP